MHTFRMYVHPCPLGLQPPANHQCCLIAASKKAEHLQLCHLYLIVRGINHFALGYGCYGCWCCNLPKSWQHRRRISNSSSTSVAAPTHQFSHHSSQQESFWRTPSCTATLQVRMDALHLFCFMRANNNMHMDTARSPYRYWQRTAVHACCADGMHTHMVSPCSLNLQSPLSIHKMRPVQGACMSFTLPMLLLLLQVNANHALPSI